jgi:hypothetical protein
MVGCASHGGVSLADPGVQAQAVFFTSVLGADVKQLLRFPSSYLGLPILLTCGITMLTYDLPDGYFEGIFLLAVTAVTIMLADRVLGIRLPEIAQFRSRRYVGTRDAFVALAFAAVVIFSACST